jgi:hypothetical protein
MKVTFDSNVWEKVFRETDETHSKIRTAIISNQISGFICEAGFRIEAIIKDVRPTYFSHPRSTACFEGPVTNDDGSVMLHLSFGPDDPIHPGLPAIQSVLLCKAVNAGVKLMRGLAWMGLPSPPELNMTQDFVSLTGEEYAPWELRQQTAFAAISKRGVGKAVFDNAGGWKGGNVGLATEKQFKKACAEWADGELVIAHIAYQNDVLCTNDHAGNSVASVFNEENRKWLSENFDVEFRTPGQLAQYIASQLE